jgi:hypothetical protein
LAAPSWSNHPSSCLIWYIGSYRLR